MAVMLNMTDLIDGIFLAPTCLVDFTSYNQTLALAVTSDHLWHVSCDIHLMTEHDQ